MILDFEQIKNITKGALYISEVDGYYTFSRFTEPQIEIYKRNSDFYMKTKATAGVRFDFETDSESFSFDYLVKRGSSRSFCYFDIYVNKELRYHVGKDKIDDNVETVNIKLSKGLKRITLYFPCLSSVFLKNVSVDDGSIISQLDYNERFLFYGDSITQGYDSFFPSLVYAMRVSDMFFADCLNQGIGAEVFDHETLDMNITYNPTKVFVAYGTNDWSHGKQKLYEEAEEYFKKICEIHKDKEIYLITPIYRLDDMTVKKPIGDFFEMCENLKNLAEKYNIMVINGTDISVPSNKAYSDNWLHPNEIGFELMAKGIYKYLKRKEEIK